jgi:hypothetical protein
MEEVRERISEAEVVEDVETTTNEVEEHVAATRIMVTTTTIMAAVVTKINIITMISTNIND